MAQHKIRLFQLAKELNVSAKDLLEMCRDNGVPVSNQLNTLEPETELLIRENVNSSTWKLPPVPTTPRVPPAGSIHPPVPRVKALPPAAESVLPRTAPVSVPTVTSVYLLAQRLKILPEDVTRICRGLGFNITNLFEPLTEPQVEAIEQKLRGSQAADSATNATGEPPGGVQTVAVAEATTPAAPLANSIPAPDDLPFIIHELAKRLGVTGASVRETCARLGIPVQNAFSVLTPEQRDLVVKSLFPSNNIPAPPTPLAVPTTVVPSPPKTVPVPAVPESTEVPSALPPLPPRHRDPAFSPDQIGTTYPLPIALAYQRLFCKSEATGRLLALFSAVEAMVRYLLALGVSDLLQCLARNPTQVSLPGSAQLGFLAKSRRMTLGDWCTALRGTANCLDAEAQRVIEELPKVCKEDTEFDIEVRWLVKTRNQCIHPEGHLAISPSEANETYRAMRPILESALRRIRFVASYPLAFAQPIDDELNDRASTWYNFHSCMGTRIKDLDEVYAEEVSIRLKEQVPFVLVAKNTRLLYLWPMLLQRVAFMTGRHSLYVLEGIPERGTNYLTQTVSNAIDFRKDDWPHTWHSTPVSDHGWLFQRLRTQPPLLTIDKCSDILAGLSTSERGQLVGQKLGEYRLTQVLGSGGFATVYLARAADNRPFAIKVLDIPDVTRHYKRFRQEFDKLKFAGQHDNIIKCFDWGHVKIKSRLYPWYSMEYALGGDLVGHIDSRRGGPGSDPVWNDATHEAEIVSEFLAVAGAVAFLHDHELIHRDIKPANVLIMEDGTLRLSDFGLGKNLNPSERTQLRGPHTETGVSMGTPYYMAPEQERANTVGPFSDVYSLGILLAELATGKRPEPRTSVTSGSTLQDDTSLRQLPTSLRDFLLHCTDVRPENRFEHAGELVKEFQQRFVRTDLAQKS